MQNIDKILEEIDKLEVEQCWYEKTTENELIFASTAESLTMETINILTQICQSNNLLFDITAEDDSIFIIIKEKEQ